MKVRRAEGSQERSVLIGMVCDRAVLGAVAARWVPGMFSSRWGNLVASWCVDYYKRYKKPPGRQLVSLFDDWALEGRRDKDTVQLVEKFLSVLSAEYSQLKDAINPEHTIDIAGRYFTKVKLKELSEEITNALEDGDTDAAAALVQQFNKIEMGQDPTINLLEDEEAMRLAFEMRSEPLITYKHGLGTFYGDTLERDGFVSFLAPEKRGKSWALVDLAWRGMLQLRKVAFFSVGDMSKAQILRRFAIRAAKTPGKPRTVKWPIGLSCNPHSPVADIEHRKKVFRKGLDFDTAWSACQNILQRRSPDLGPLLKLSVHPNSSVNVHGIISIIETWERQGWIPDVVVIDYADVLSPPAGISDTREQINTTWKTLRALSQTMHCLVVTATQAKATSYDAHTLSRSEFSEDKRKLAHVTGMVGLNQTPTEKELGIMRYNWVVRREEEYSDIDCCHVATCLALANPCVLSVM